MTTDQHSHVYIVGADHGLLKIGKANKPEQRLLALHRPGIRLWVIDAVPVARREALAVERYAHYLLRENRKDGEWFDVTRNEAISAIHAGLEAVRAGKTAPKPYELRWLIAVGNALADRVDSWRGKQRPIPNRSEAVRQLMEKALEAEGE